MSIKKLHPIWLDPKSTAISLAKRAKQSDENLYNAAQEAVKSAIRALTKFGVGIISDYGDVEYVLMITVNEDGNDPVAWIDYAADKEGTRRLESTGPDAQLLVTAFATYHPDACFMYSMRDNPGNPNPILLCGKDPEDTRGHLSTNNVKKFLDNNITTFTVACRGVIDKP